MISRALDMLPGMNGQELLCEVRKISDAPVLMMTALDDDDSQLHVFTNLADDYVTKPFTMQILVKSVEELLRWSGYLKDEISVGGLTLHPFRSANRRRKHLSCPSWE